ncbi:MAG TPA: TonB-dependent receptor [Bryobacteraceae bacterium]
MTSCLDSRATRVFFQAALCLILLSSLALAQSTLGTILGRVIDPSGAAAPGVNVTLRNEGTNVSSSQVTNPEGEYVFSNIKPGTYQLTFDGKGFAPHTVEHLPLEVNQTVRQDVSLRLGTVASSVQVTAEKALVQTDTSSVGSVIESNQVQRMPLNGRTNMFGLLALSPGVQSAGTNPRIGGSSWIGTQATMDGSLNMEMENARLSNADPSLESLAEFRVINSTGSAEYGGGTAQVIASTKSGSNEFHGSLFEYNRNRATAAKNFFATGLPKAPYNRNEFGGSFGGPIKRDKLFFFGSYEALTFRSSSTNQSAQPTTALLNGDFSGLPPIKDPFSQQVYAGNQIPASQINSSAKALSPFFSTPNRPTSAPAGLGTNYIVNLPSQQHNYRYEGRVDYTFNATNTLFARYFYTDIYNYVPGATEKFGGDNQPLANQNFVVNYTSTLSPTLVNVAVFGLQRETDTFYNQNYKLDPASLVPGIVQYPGLGGVPTISITGFTGLSDALGSGDTIPNYHFSDTTTWTKGKHTVKGGFSLLRYQFLSYGNQDPKYGAVSFTGQYTGNAFADFLLGYASGSSKPLGPSNIEAQNYRYGFFLQDDWRISSRLTMNVGLRYDLPTLYVNSKGDMVNWYQNLNALVILLSRSNAGAYPGLPIVSGQSIGLNTGNYLNNDLKQVAPRFGLAYRPLSSNRLVLRGGYGIYYDPMPWKFGSYILGTNPPFAGTISYEPSSNTIPTLSLNNAFPVGSGSTPSGVGIVAQDPSARYPLTHQWNATVEAQLSSDTVVRATYLGSERQHSGMIYPINTPLAQPGAVQTHRPYQPFGNISLYTNGQTANTQQLQLSLQRRYTSGLSFQVEYSLTKALDSSATDTGTPSVPNNWRLDRGNDSMIRTHYLVANYVYELPFGRSLHGLPAILLSGWQTSGIVTAASGLPFSVNFTSSLLGQPSGRADIVGNPAVDSPGINGWFNPQAYAVPAPFAYGNSAPNSLWGPGLVTWDMGAFKNFRFRERWNLQFRSEFFNTLNHANFSNPQNNISSPTQVGKIVSTSTGPRVVQFALRLEF